ncbi:MAG: fluoride efflux transporter CrcB [Holophagales bacterium]|jgi:CrcB protein|nr:fluoride efflux transporter CrcB [Holophagales bacterium]
MRCSITFDSILSICAGASLGATSRWLIGLALNSIFPPIPIGTLAANLIGGYCIGLLMCFFAFFPAVAPEWHLFAITGFLSSLTTLSTFSAEIVALLQQGRFVMALSGAALHVLGSLLMTILGIASFGLLRQL